MAKFYWRNDVIQNLRAYFILYVITIKWTMCLQEKIELSKMLQRPRLSCTKLRRSLLIYKYKATIKNCKTFPWVAKSWCPVVQGWHLLWAMGLEVFKTVGTIIWGALTRAKYGNSLSYKGGNLHTTLQNKLSRHVHLYPPHSCIHKYTIFT